MKKPLLAAYCSHKGIQTMTVQDVQHLDILYYALA